MSRERPAPLMLVVAPTEAATPFGSYASVVETGMHLLAGELSRRLGAAGAAVVPLPPQSASRDSAFHWGRWFVAAARDAMNAARAEGREVDAIGYAGPGSLALLPDAELDELLAPLSGEVVANNRFSADAFVVAESEHREAPDGTMRHGVSLERILDRLEACPTDNAAVRCLETLGLASRDLTTGHWARFDVDTPLDLALLRLATRLPGMRAPDASVSGFLEMARLPGGGELAVPNLDRIGSVIRNRFGELVIAGRIPAVLLRELETESACRVRAFVEERGMRSARDQRPRSLLARWVQEHGPASLVKELAALGDAVILDTRVLMAAQSGSAEEHHWPPAEERFASDFGDTAPIRTDWLRELVEAANTSRVPFLLGGHALIADGLSLVVAAAWVGR